MPFDEDELSYLTRHFDAQTRHFDALTSSLNKLSGALDKLSGSFNDKSCEDTASSIFVPQKNITAEDTEIVCIDVNRNAFYTETISVPCFKDKLQNEESVEPATHYRHRTYHSPKQANRRDERRKSSHWMRKKLRIGNPTDPTGKCRSSVKRPLNHLLVKRHLRPGTILCNENYRKCSCGFLISRRCSILEQRGLSLWFTWLLLVYYHHTKKRKFEKKRKKRIFIPLCIPQVVDSANLKDLVMDYIQFFSLGSLLIVKERRIRNFYFSVIFEFDSATSKVSLKDNRPVTNSYVNILV